MKIRNGFVSNSSSSSFVIITTKDALKETLSSFSLREKKFIEEILKDEGVTVLNGQEFVVYLRTLYDDTLYETYSTILSEKERNDENEWNGYLEIFDRFLNTLENTENCFVKKRRS